MRHRTAVLPIVLLALAAGAFPAPGWSAAREIAYLTAPSAADPAAIALDFARAHRADYGLSAADVSELVVVSQHASRHNGVTHVLLQQRHLGIDVAEGLFKVNVGPDGRIFLPGNRLAADLAARRSATAPVLSAAQAVSRAAEHLGLAAPPALNVLLAPAGAAREVVFAGGALSRTDIKVRLVYVKGDALRLAWDLNLQPSSDHYWQLRVDAVDGRVLQAWDLVERDSYKVFPLPQESPDYGSPPPPADGRTVVADPADNALGGGAPAGWLGGTSTLEGLFVRASTDLDANDAFTPGTDVFVDGGITQTFDAPLDLSLGPDAYRAAAVINLFYWNNIAHDIHYRYGFDSANFNFEATDAVFADAQDGSATNNANFLTLPEGTPPRMQMFVWLAPPSLVVNAPPAIAGVKTAAGSSFGAALTTTGTTGDVQLYDDGTANPSQGCADMAPGSLAGKIALIDRGTCEFGTKVLNAEQAGAIAAIVANNQGDTPIAMGPGAEGAAVTIPSLMIGRSDGQAIKAQLALPATVNVTLKGGVVKDRDSDLDAPVIVHEYGHGVSTRLTGDGVNILCLQNAQSGGMGEGWSDWWALAFTDTGADVPNHGADGRGMGTYIAFQPTTGPGIRRFPFSTDLTVNPFTYGDVEADPEVHAVGEKWTAILWEVYWALVDEYGFDADLYTGTAGNNKALQLVMDGLKMQPCNPTFVDARDAILAADLALGGADRCRLWTAFAKRGLGFLAEDGGSDASVNVTEDFNPHPDCLSSLPFANPDSAVTERDVAVTIDVLANDFGSGIDIIAVTQPASGAVVINDGAPDTVTFTPAAGHVGTVDFTYTIDDTSAGPPATAVVTVTVECPGGPGFSDDFEGGAEPGWQVDTARNDPGDGVSPPWSISVDAGAHSPTMSYTSSGVSGTGAADDAIKDDRLASPAFLLTAGSEVVFWQHYNLENGFDGGVLEVTDDGGATWRDVITAGGVFTLGGYSGAIDSGFESPIAGRDAWTGTSAGDPTAMVETRIDVGALSGGTVRFRWRLALDNGFLVPGVAWYIDDVEVTSLGPPPVCTVDPPPVAVDDLATTGEGEAETIAVLANDLNGPLALQSVTQPAAGTGSVTANPDDTVTYTPPPCFHGTAVFTYTAENTAGTDVGQVSVTVTPDGAACFFTVTPCRVLDTRNGDQGGALASNAERTLQIGGNCAVPVDVSAVSANVTVTGPTNAGHLSFYPVSGPPPGQSTINFGPGQTRSNNAILQLDAAGQVQARPFILDAPGPDEVQVILDVNGFFID